MKALLLGGLLLMLIGCSSTPPEPQIIYRTLYVTPTESWTRDTRVAPPPARDAYKEAPMELRLKMMTDAYINQTKQVTSCNIDKAAIREYVLEVTTPKPN